MRSVFMTECNDGSVWRQQPEPGLDTHYWEPFETDIKPKRIVHSRYGSFLISASGDVFHPDKRDNESFPQLKSFQLSESGSSTFSLSTNNFISYYADGNDIFV